MVVRAPNLIRSHGAVLVGHVTDNNDVHTVNCTNLIDGSAIILELIGLSFPLLVINSWNHFKFEQRPNVLLLPTVLDNEIDLGHASREFRLIL